MEPTVTLARRFWAAIEPIHSVVYFAPEPLEAARKTGLRGFWMSYFASRVAPLGAAARAGRRGHDVRVRARHGRPRHSRRVAVRRAGGRARGPAGERPRGAAAPRRRGPCLARPPANSRTCCGRRWRAAGSTGGRWPPRGRGCRGPADPVGALWLAATVLREHRGDGHVLAGVAHGLRGLDATVTFAATGAITRGHGPADARAGPTRTGRSHRGGCRPAGCSTPADGSPRPAARCAARSRT